MADPEDRNFDPSTPEANRAAQQGLGVGARELKAQADPTPGEGSAPFHRGHGAEVLDEDSGDPIEGLEQGRTVTSPDGADAPGTDVEGGNFRGAPD